MRFPGWLLLCVVASAEADSALDSRNQAALSVLHQRCFSCHNEEDRKGGLILSSRSAIEQANEEFPLIVFGLPDQSELIKVLTPDADPHMPPKEQLSTEEIETLREWVRSGAVWEEMSESVGESAPPPVGRNALLSLAPTLTPALALALSANGERLAASAGSRIRVLSNLSEDHFQSDVLTGHRDLVRALVWNPIAKGQLFSGGYRRIVCWDAEVAEPSELIEDGLTGQITALEISSDGSQLWVASSRPGIVGEILSFSLPSFELRAKWEAHQDTIFAMDLSADGSHLASASGDRTMAFWETDTGFERARIEAHGTQIMSLSFSPDTRRIVTAGTDHQLRVWEWSKGDPLFSLGRHQKGLFATHWSEDGTSIIAGDERGVLFRYTDIEEHSGAAGARAAKEKRMASWGDTIQCLTSDPSGGRIYVGSQSGTVRIVDQDGKLIREIAATAPSG